MLYTFPSHHALHIAPVVCTFPPLYLSPVYNGDILGPLATGGKWCEVLVFDFILLCVALEVLNLLEVIVIDFFQRCFGEML